MSQANQETPERELIVRAQRGESSAYNELVLRHRQKCYRVAYSLLGNMEDAMDVTQEALMRAHKSLDRFEVGRPFFPWLCTITRNLGLTLLDKKKRRGFSISLDQNEPEDRIEIADDKIESPDQQLYNKELESQIQVELETLKPQDREMIVCRDIQGYSYQEISEILEIPIGTVMSRLYYAREKLRKKLERYLK